MIHQCPQCELRFAREAELTEHLGHDHGVDASVYERYRYPAERPTLAPLYADMSEGARPRRYLVVANQTLGGEALTARVRDFLETGPAVFHLLVPATRSSDYVKPPEPSSPAAEGTDTDEAGLAQANWRLRRGLETIRGLGAEVSGQVGPPDPVEAVAGAFERAHYDEVLVATLPAGMSRWLEMGLPQRIERRWRVPVSTVVVSQPQLGTAPLT
jgi:hypothetical protein